MKHFRNATAAVFATLALAIVLGGKGTAQTGPIAPDAKGDLHVLAVGVSQYEKPGNDLQWADQDAIDHAEFWAGQQGRLFGKVHVRKLLNREATRARILEAMKEIEGRARKGETVIAPFSGHGTNPNYGEWRFCAADGFITASELRGWASRLAGKGVRVILIIDACFAGSVNFAIDGVVVLAASEAGETSLDGDTFELKGNGLFTRVLLEALGGKADANKDGIVTLQEAMDYVAREVKERARKLGKRRNKKPEDQQPRLFRTDSTPDSLPLVQLGAVSR
jgi:hypothetical protein